jgi:hypothetical protein
MHTICSSLAFYPLPLPTVHLCCTRCCTPRASMALTVDALSLSALVPPQASSGDSNLYAALRAPAPGRVSQLQKGNVDYGTPWELEDVSGTVGKLSASCFEVTGSLSKSQGFPKSYVSKSSEGSSLARLCSPLSLSATSAVLLNRPAPSHAPHSPSSSIASRSRFFSPAMRLASFFS